jgi:hypothetical protein
MFSYQNQNSGVIKCSGTRICGRLKNYREGYPGLKIEIFIKDPKAVFHKLDYSFDAQNNPQK